MARNEDWYIDLNTFEGKNCVFREHIDKPAMEIERSHIRDRLRLERAGRVTVMRDGVNRVLKDRNGEVHG